MVENLESIPENDMDAQENDDSCMSISHNEDSKSNKEDKLVIEYQNQN